MNNVLGCFNLKICSQNIHGQGANNRDKKKLRKKSQGKRYNIGVTEAADLKTWQNFFGTENVHLTKAWTWGKGAAIAVSLCPIQGTLIKNFIKNKIYHL